MGHIELVEQINNRVGQLAPPLTQPLMRELGMVLHKISHPMAEILDKIPGGVTGQAGKIGVSRQTVYVWRSERFRPTLKQAKRIARVTGVPVEHILEDGFEQKPRRKARKKVARVATRSKKATKRKVGATPSRRRKRNAESAAGTA